MRRRKRIRRTAEQRSIVKRLVELSGPDSVVIHRDVKPDIIDAERAEWRRVWSKP